MTGISRIFVAIRSTVAVIILVVVVEPCAAGPLDNLEGGWASAQQSCAEDHPSGKDAIVVRTLGSKFTITHNRKRYSATFVVNRVSGNTVIAECVNSGSAPVDQSGWIYEFVVLSDRFSMKHLDPLLPNTGTIIFSRCQ
ncbi:hypothetical protein [Methylobacterium sp. UNC378MF]|uniref:hypothetical protein n=1 Tax=Methylobacterium sp. UNC378MF TaxID=1502748 RepID=UPI0011135096|nr:hypothetical protein [Methylobacterium sp. UNC378MF]